MDFSSHNPNTSNALSLAARHNDVKSVQRLLKKINPNCVDNRGWTCLHEAAYADSYESLVAILKHKHCRPMCETHEGHTALYLACRNKASLQTITLLLDRVHDIANFGSTEGVTPLHLASTQGRNELIQLLLDYGALLNVQDFDGDTPLHDAVLSVQYESVMMLLHAGADASIANESGGYTPFHLAASKGNLAIVKAILPFVTNINQGSKGLHTAFMLSILGGNLEIIDLLLEHGADPHLKDAKGNMALDVALTHGSYEIFRKMFSVTDISKINKDIIYNACKPHYLQKDILRLLLNSDLGPKYFDFDDSNEINIFQNASRTYNPNYTKNAPLNVYLNICDYIYNTSPELFYEYFLLFLMRGVDVNAASCNECPPLIFALLYCYNRKCFKPIFDILIAHGCNVDYCRNRDICPEECVPDAFMTVLFSDTSAILLLLPYSLYFTPGLLLATAHKRGVANTLHTDVYHYLINGIDDVQFNATHKFISNFLPSLKQICRHEIRRAIKNKTNAVKRSSEFVDIINSLPLPPPMCDYCVINLN